MRFAAFFQPLGTFFAEFCGFFAKNPPPCEKFPALPTVNKASAAADFFQKGIDFYKYI